MASTTAANFVVVRDWVEGGVTGRDRIGKLVRLTNGTFGGATNTILASSLNLTKVESTSATAIREDNSIVYLITPSYDGTKLFLFNIENATDASRGDPADVTLSNVQYLQFEVKGY